jgi:uncharacterized membrane protein
MEYLVVKWLHILSSTVLFGTGLGSAFYMFFVSRTRNPQVVATVAGYVVLADWIFTTPTVIFQPISGLYLMHLAHLKLTAPWIIVSLALYLVAVLAWLPVVWMQLQMRDLARRTEPTAKLPYLYWNYLRWWVGLGVIAFLALVLVFYLMVVKSF